jgi:hypothetical protein
MSPHLNDRCSEWGAIAAVPKVKLALRSVTTSEEGKLNDLQPTIFTKLTDAHFSFCTMPSKSRSQISLKK